MKEKIRIGVIGTGDISRRHFMGYRSITDRSQIVAVCDVKKEKAEEAASEFSAKVYTDYHELLADPTIQMVDIILPHTLHYPVAKDAIAAGKNVLMEKPITVDPEQGLDLIKRAEAAGVTFTIAENTRFVAAYTESLDTIKNKLGDIRLVKTFISGSEVWRLVKTELWKGRKDGSGGGSIIDAGAHSFYLLKWMFGGVKDVQTFQEKLVPESQVEDNGIVVGHLNNGGLFFMETSFTAESPWNEQLEVYGSEGTLIINQLNNPPVRLFMGKKDFCGSSIETVPFNPTSWKYVSIAAGVVDFVDSLIEGRKPKVDPMDAYYAVKVISKAYESSSLGQPVSVE